MAFVCFNHPPRRGINMQYMMIECQLSQKVLDKVWAVLCWLHVNSKTKKVVFAFSFCCLVLGGSLWFCFLPPQLFPPTCSGVETSELSSSYFISAGVNFIVLYVIDPIRHTAKTPPSVAPKNLTDLFMNMAWNSPAAVWGSCWSWKSKILCRDRMEVHWGES